MKKELVIEMEEERITCPKLSLTTKNVYADIGETYKFHQCEFLDFCKQVRKNWEDVKKKGKQL